MARTRPGRVGPDGKPIGDNIDIPGGDGFQRHPPVKTLKLHFLCFCLGMFFMQIGWVISGQN